jgi:uncharacterized phage protein (TIGR01671 family)
MSTTIKFKAYLPFSKKIKEVKNLDFTDELVTVEGGIYRLNEVVLLQFTGLKDKNGTDIYEGDMIKINRYTDDIEMESVISSIKWEEHSISFNWVESWCFDRYYTLAQAYRYTHDLGQNWGFTFEVIGNIHESPELLNLNK